jgi:ABC-type Zn uptake system ZnuABC Zn-binding protein ZnuA
LNGAQFTLCYLPIFQYARLQPFLDQVDDSLVANPVFDEFDGISQKELADRLAVNISQVSRDESNEYHGISLDRAQRILDALGERLVTAVEERQASVAS